MIKGKLQKIALWYFYDHRALICTMFVPGITEDCIVVLL